MIKAVKKLKKLWSRKKKRKKITHQEPYYYLPPPPPRRPPPPPPPSYHCCYSYSTPVQPTAPPLPPWLEPDQQTHEIISPADQLGYQSQIHFPSQEIVMETNASYPATLPDDTPLLYQQYADPNPVYGVPIVGQTPTSEKSGGFFGCFAKFGEVLIRCFCPCFHIREVH